MQFTGVADFKFIKSGRWMLKNKINLYESKIFINN